jgi:hypothetical protein
MEVIWTRNQPLGNKPPSPLQLELVVKEANFLLAQMVKTLISLSLSLIGQVRFLWKEIEGFSVQLLPF